MELGRVCTSSGSHWRPAEEGKPFAILMHRLGIQRPNDEIVLTEKSKVCYWEPKDERKKRGRSTLHPWICLNCGLKLRATSKGEISSTYDDCGVKYAREAILNPNLPEKEKDQAVESAISTIQKVAERKDVYYAKHGKGRRTRKPRIIYEAPKDKEPENIPTVIQEIKSISKTTLSKI